MKNLVIAVVVSLLASSCSQGPSLKSYDNPDIGLHITYPETWQVVKKETVKNAIAEAEKHMTISQENIDVAQELAPSIILTLAKPQKVAGSTGTPNVNVFVISIPEDEWGDVDLDSLVKEQIEEIEVSFPEAEVTTDVFPLPDYPTIHHYSSRIPVQGRTVTQYMYLYWHPPYFVQIAFSFSDPDDEREIKEIIGSMKIESSGKPEAAND